MTTEQPVDVDGLIDHWDGVLQHFVDAGGEWARIDQSECEQIIDTLTRLKAAEAEVESYQQILADRVGPDIAAINALEAENAALQSRLTALVEALEGLMKAYRYATGLEGAYDEALVNAREAIRAAAEGGAMTTPTAREIVERLDGLHEQWKSSPASFLEFPDALAESYDHIKALLQERDALQERVARLESENDELKTHTAHERSYLRVSVERDKLQKRLDEIEDTC